MFFAGSPPIDVGAAFGHFFMMEKLGEMRGGGIGHCGLDGGAGVLSGGGREFGSEGEEDVRGAAFAEPEG